MRKRELITVLMVLMFAISAMAATEQVLYTFKGGAAGAFPSSSLVRDGKGNLYGTTSSGGNLSVCTKGFFTPGCGVVFELSLVNGSWQESVLYTFQGGTDGAGPGGNLVFDAAGNLFGTTSNGGSTSCGNGLGCGTVFELSPQADGSWKETILHVFGGQPDGAFPAGLTPDALGNLYGVATSGGANGRGAVYELSKQSGTLKESVIYSLRDFEVQPNPGLAFDSAGNLYGTFFQLYGCFGSAACGAVFELSQANGMWTEMDLVDFAGGGNGGDPMAGVILDSAGNIYGTTAKGGNNYGIAYELKRSGSKIQGVMLHNFCSLNNCADGAVPLSALAADASGNFYGTTSTRGTACSSCGTVYKLFRGKLGWEEMVLHSFRGGTDGSYPTQSLILDAQGNLYGVTSGTEGSDALYGTVFEVTQ